MGESVEGGVVDRCAQHFAKRGGTKRRVVVDVAAIRTRFADSAMGECVKFEQVHTGLGLLCEFSQDLGDKATYWTHLVDKSGAVAGNAHELLDRDAGAQVVADDSARLFDDVLIALSLIPEGLGH